MLGFGFFAKLAIGAVQAVYIVTRDEDSPPDPELEFVGKAGAGVLTAVADAADAGINTALKW